MICPLAYISLIGYIGTHFNNLNQYDMENRIDEVYFFLNMLGISDYCERIERSDCNSSTLVYYRYEVGMLEGFSKYHNNGMVVYRISDSSTL